MKEGELMGQAVSMGNARIIRTEFQSENVKRRNNFRDLGVDGTLIPKHFLKKL
jgi:hypothetical protein